MYEIKEILQDKPFIREIESLSEEKRNFKILQSYFNQLFTVIYQRNLER